MIESPMKNKMIRKSMVQAVLGNEPIEIDGEMNFKDFIGEVTAQRAPHYKGVDPLVILFTSNKGGVGKTFSSVNFSWFLTARGKDGKKAKVLHLELDAQGNFAFSVEEKGFESDKSFYDYISGKSSLSEITSQIDEGLYYIGGNRDLSLIDPELRKLIELKKDSPTKKDFADIVNERTRGGEIFEKYYRELKEYFKQFDYVVIDSNPEINLFNRISMQVCDVALLPVQSKNSAIKGYMVTVQEIINSQTAIGRSEDDIISKTKALFVHNDSIPNKEREKSIIELYRALGNGILADYIDLDWYAGSAADNGLPAFTAIRSELEKEDIAQIFKTVQQIGKIINAVIALANGTYKERFIC